MSRYTVALLLGLAACSRARESTGTANTALVAPVDTAGIGETTASVQERQEPSADFVDDRTLVVGFNTSGTGNQGWAVSTDFGHTFPLQCDFTGTVLAGGPCTPVPLPANAPNPWSWSGDPIVRGDGHGNFVFVSLANPTTDQDAAHFVAVAVSSNRGASFDSSVLVNDAGCGSSGLSPAVDQPNATFDYTTDPPTLWVVYRFFGSGTQTFAGACVRRGVVEKSANIARLRWLEDAHNVDGLGASGFGFPYTYGVAVVAGDGVLTVMSSAGTSFMPNANSKNPHQDPCPDDSPDLNGMAWATVDSFDNGHTWVDNAKVFHSEQSQWCVLAESANTRGGSRPTVGKVLMGLRQFGITRAPGGIEYAVLQDTHTSARLFMRPAAGTKGWQNPTSTLRSWYEWCPGTPTSNVPGGPTSNWKTTGTGNGDEPACVNPAIQPVQGPSGSLPLDLLWPTIAADGRGNVMISDIEDTLNDPAAAQQINYAVRGIVNPHQAGAKLQGPTFVRSASFLLPYANTSPFFRPMGDYGWVAVHPTGNGTAFHPPGCSTTNDFFVAWTANDGSGRSEIITRGFSLTP